VSTTTAAALEDAGRPHLPISRILGYSAGDAGCNIAFQMTGLFLLVFYTDVVGIDPVHAAASSCSSRSGTRSPTCSPDAWSTAP
jgi:hypothetical protein